MLTESVLTLLDKSEASLQQYKTQIDKLNEELSELQRQLALSKDEKVSDVTCKDSYSQ